MVGDKKDFHDVVSKYLNNKGIDHKVNNSEIVAEEEDLRIEIKEDCIEINNNEKNNLSEIDQYI